MAGTGDNRVTINMKDLALQYQPKYALNGNIYGQVNLDDPDKLLYQEPADFKTPIYPATYSNGKFVMHTWRAFFITRKNSKLACFSFHLGSILYPKHLLFSSLDETYCE